MIFNLTNIFADNFNDSTILSNNYIKLEINNQINFNISFEKKYKIDYFYLNSYLFFKTINNSQYLNEFNTNFNNYELINEKNNFYLKYIFDNSNLKNYNKINEKFILESTKFKPKIYNKISFPDEKLNQIYKNNYSKYIKFYDLIDINEDIKKQANELAKGENDLFIISSRIAKWIREDINYDLKSALKNPNQKSTDVFKSKKGVCKEITNLYVSMIRSLGIPARLVSGYAYTNSNELIDYLNSNWGGHVWAEVLIGNTWVPFDLTYNEYGYVDATHIITQITEKSENFNLKINGNGYGFNIVKNSLNTKNNFKILDSKNIIINDNNNNNGNINNKLFNIELEGTNQIGFGSYGYIKVKIRNNEDYYQVLFLNLVKTPEVELLDSNMKMLILKPKEEKDFYFRFKLPNNLDKDYEYTFPFTISNEFIKKKFKVKSKSTFNKIKKIAIPNNYNESQNYSNNKININCEFEISTKYNNIICNIENPNNYNINNLNICLKNIEKLDKENKNDKNIKEECKNINLNINGDKTIIFNTSNFISNISYLYSHICGHSSCIEKESILLNNSNLKPELNFSFNNETNKFKIKIINYQKGTVLNLYQINSDNKINNNENNNYDNSDKKLITSFKSNSGFIFLKGKDKNNYLLELKLNEQIIEMKRIELKLNDLNNYQIEILKAKDINKELTILDKIIIWLKDFFKYNKSIFE